MRAIVGTVAALFVLAGCAGSAMPAGRGSGVVDTGVANTAAASTVVADTAFTAAAHHAAAGRPHARADVRVAAVGDVILGNTPSVPSHPVAYLHPIARVLQQRAQLVFGNLEGTLTTATSSKCGSGSGSDCFAFRNPPHFAKALARSGFTVLGDANNHSHDFGNAGLRQTVRSIHHAGMAQTGLPGEVTGVKAGHTRVAVLAFAPYSSTADLLDLPAAKRLIERARRHAPIVVVYMHAGAEGTGAQHVTGHEEHYVGEDRGNPKHFAHLAIRAGASLVIGSGPHVLRGMQFYRGHLIAYSLGNFANFHNFAGGGVLSRSAILHVTLTRSGRFRTGRLISIRLDSSGRASPSAGSLGVVRRLSRADFGHSAARLTRHGVISAPRP